MRKTKDSKTKAKRSKDKENRALPFIWGAGAWRAPYNSKEKRGGEKETLAWEAL